MKKSVLDISVFIFSSCLFFLASCKKYDEGGLINQTDKNLTTGNWILSRYLKNGVDKTSTLFISGYRETYSDNNVYTRSYSDKNGRPVNDDGRWQHEKSNESLSISDVSSIEINTESGTVSSSYFNIIRLTKNEYWYYFINGGDRHEFRFMH